MVFILAIVLTLVSFRYIIKKVGDNSFPTNTQGDRAMRFSLYALTEPRRFSIGRINGEPVYGDCVECGSHEPVIHGFAATTGNPTFLGMAIRTKADGTSHVVLWCATCWDNS